MFANILKLMLNEFCAKHGHENCSVGITEDITRSLFARQEVDSDSGEFKLGQADTVDDAREIREFLMEKGVHGGSDHGQSPTYVFVHVKAPGEKHQSIIMNKD